MKRYLIIILMFFSSLLLFTKTIKENPNIWYTSSVDPFENEIRERCQFKRGNKLISLSGFVKVVDSNADFKVKIVDSADSPDVVVEILPKGSSSSYCGEWSFWSETRVDFTIQYIDTLPDFTIAWALPKIYYNSIGAIITFPETEPSSQSSSVPSPRFGTINTSNCTYTNRWGKTVPLYGRVEVVSSAADFTVEVVNASPDLEVEETYPAHNCGQWEFVSMSADFTIEFVHMAADVKVKFVNSSPGFR